MPPKASFLSAIKEDSSFLRQYLWKYRKLAGLGLLSLVIVDLLEVLPPLFLKKAIDILTDGRPKKYLAWLALAYLGTSLIQGFGRYGWRVYLMRGSLYSGRDLRDRFSDHLFGLCSSFFDRRRIGDLMSLSTNDCDAVRMALGPGLLIMADSLFYFLTVPIAMILLSPRLALLSFLPLILIPWIVLRNEREIHSRFERVQESFSKLSAHAQESLGGIRVIKAFAREDARLGQFREAGEEYIDLNMKLAWIQSSFGPTLDFFMSLGVVLLLFVGGKYVMIGAITLGTFVAFQRYIQKMIWPMAAVGLAITHYQRAVASSGRLKEVLAIPTDVPESPEPCLPANYPENGARALWRTDGRVELRNLGFRFPGTERTVLHGVSLTIEPGERVAFVGPIGAGKSALLGLLPRLYPVARGMLFIDGVDVNDWPVDELRKQIGYVSQDLFLFSESVLENIAYGLREGAAASAKRELVERAAALAAMQNDITGFPKGFETKLGERGVNVSGGQKQRLTIARAVMKEPSILILDDALSSVDTQTEEKILRGLRSRPGKNTELIAAHRISTIQDADRIVVLDQGRVIEMGRHSELIALRDGFYRKLYDQQRLKEDLERYVEEVEESL